MRQLAAIAEETIAAQMEKKAWGAKHQHLFL